MKSLRLGHVHLKVRDLELSQVFYQRLLGLDVTERVGPFAFLSDGGVHHSLALQELGSVAPLPNPGSVGLYHTAFETSDAAGFLAAWERAEALTEVAAVDHGISWALYLRDPDGNGVEIYLDRRHAPGGRDQWMGQQIALRKARVQMESGVPKLEAEASVSV